jgi:RNA-directed DNA polymerase
VGKSDPKEKSFDIPKRLVWEAYKSVKANKGAAGVDGQSIEEFEADLSNNLYKIWNRMSSGTYFPPPVRAVEIPKPHGGGTRILGIPTVADRIAQTVVALQLLPRTESIFHDDSYGYRPGRSPLMAVKKCRQRCWKKDWVLDLDVQKFFDSVDHDLMVKAVEANTDQKWVVLYVKRWLAAPMQMPDGTVVERDRGTPQGSAVSPVLANLFMNYAFDWWLEREFPTVQFERFADDAVVHCVTERQARQVWAALADRLESVGLRLHPDKTKIVYCGDSNRKQKFDCISFTFLGYAFRPRESKAGKTGSSHSAGSRSRPVAASDRRTGPLPPHLDTSTQVKALVVSHPRAEGSRRSRASGDQAVTGSGQVRRARNVRRSGRFVLRPRSVGGWL